MVTITINNSYSRIEGLSVSQEKELREVLSYVVGGSSSYFSGFGPKRRSLLDKKGYFPTGLIYRVNKWLGSNDITTSNTTYNDKRLHPQPKYVYSNSPLKNIVPYEDQKLACDLAQFKGQGIITMPTGSGKSLVIALISARLNVKTLVVVPSIEIREQLTKSLLDALGPKHKVTVENIDSTRLPKLKDFDCLIIDEAHHSASKTYQKLNKTAWASIYYRFFLTATPFRNDTEETLLFESIAGRVIFQLSYQDAVYRGYIVPVEAYTIEIPKQKTDAYTYQQVYKELVVNNEARNTIISDLLINFEASKTSTLCLVREVAHGKILSELTGLPFVSGEDNESRKYIAQFNQGKIKVLIGTTGVISEGVDTKPCEYVIIAGLGKAKSNIMQSIGRVLRTYPGKTSGKVILIKDKSHRFCTRHFNEQCKILLNEYSTRPIKLEI
jgi:superfamily II DNA or RNA helicase